LKAAATKLRAPLVGWFHLGSEEAAGARAFLRLCNTEDSVDELGFGILRDGFSDQFFPGTSTVMTDVRYLLFVAEIYRFMERSLQKKRSAIPDPTRRSRAMQDQLRDVLKATFGNKHGHGVIGILVNEPERYPSAIYWASLRTLGIFKLAGTSESDYLRGLARHHDLARVDENGGDPVAEVAPSPVNWDRCLDQVPSVLNEKGRFPDGVDFELSEPEGRYLRDCYLGPDEATRPANGIHRSLLAHLIERRRKTPFDYPWDVASPAHLQEAVGDARLFSLLARGATLQYYHWLFSERRARGWATPDADISGWFDDWWVDGRPELLNWDLGAFLQRRRQDVRSHRDDARFLERWLQSCKSAQSAPGFLTDVPTRDLIVGRERSCKPKKARLADDKHLKTWKGVPRDSESIYQLNYRARIGSRFVTRIVRAMEAGQA